MLRIALVLAGGSLGAAVAAILVYVFGASLEAAEIQFYGSELDQQRNFNLAVLFVGGLTVLGAWLGYKRGKSE